MNSFKPAGRLARWILAGLFALVGLLPAGLSAGPAKTFQNPILSGFSQPGPGALAAARILPDPEKPVES
jgi:hypothetical protein